MVADQLELRDFSIYVRVWDQLNWTLSPKYEFLVNKHTTMRGLAAQIHACLALHDPAIAVLPEEMDICRILSIHKFGIIDLVDMEVLPPRSSTLAWSARPAFSGNRCSSTPTVCSTSSSRPASTPETSLSRKNRFSAARSRLW
jgi:hypothetical protein